MKGFSETLVTLAVAIIGLATLSVIISRKSATVDVIKTAGDAFNNAIRAAVAPVSGASSIGGNGTLNKISNITSSVSKIASIV